MPKTKRNSTGASPDQKLIEVQGELSQQLTPTTIKIDALEKYRDIILQRHKLSMMVGLYHNVAMIHCGESLLEVKSMLPHGEFSAWVTENFSPDTGLTLRTCQRYMAKAKAFRKFLKGKTATSENATVVSHLENEALVSDFLQSLANSEKAVPRLEKQSLLSTHIVDSVRTFLGTIDFDPCAVAGQSHVQPGGIELFDHNHGLQPTTIWSGNVFGCLNLRTGVDPWVRKGLIHLQQGEVTNVVFHLPFEQIPSVLNVYPATSFCVLTPAQGGQSPVNDKPATLAYMSLNPRRREFVDAFQALGTIVVTVTKAERDPGD